MNDTNSRRMRRIWFLFGLIVFCSPGSHASILPPDPDNAALLYYQAFLLRPEPDYVAKELVYGSPPEQFYEVLAGGKLEFGTETEEEIRRYEEMLKNDDTEPNTMMSEMELLIPEFSSKGFILERLSTLRKRQEHEDKMRGVAPNVAIRKYMRKCREAIEVAQLASEMPECRWGFRYSRGRADSMALLIEIRELHTVLRTDAFLLAADGHYREAFERCLMLHRFGRHVGDDSWLLYWTSDSIGSNALRFIRIILGHTKLDLATLTWLKDQLKAEDSPPMSLVRMLKMEVELYIRQLKTNEKLLSSVRMELSEKTSSGNVSKKIDSLSDDELIGYVERISSAFLSDTIQAIGRKASYSEKCAELKRLKDEIENEFDGSLNPCLWAMRWSSDPPAWYKHHVLHIAHLNAHMAGMDIMLISKRTGRVPERIPDGLPRDPFTGKDFKYEINEDGFMLSLPDKNLPKMKLRPYEFKVKK